MSTNADNGPSAFRFSSVLRGLVASGDARGVIRLVERWLEYGTVSQTARIAQSRAFMDLRLMDRAWVRLREAAGADPSSIEVQLLTAEMFIERGWPAKAATLLDKLKLDGVPDDTKRRFASLRALAASPPKVPPPNAADIEAQGKAEAVLALAERYMAVGMIVRAESLLERLLRDGYSPPRVADLLWALGGDFLSARTATEDLLDALDGDSLTADWGGIEKTDSTPAVEVTAHVEVADLNAAMVADVDRRGFPALFRRNDPNSETTDAEEGEVTMASVVVESGSQQSSDVYTDPGLTPIPGHDDTRIMEVIQNGEGFGLGQASGPIHRRSGQGVSNPLDLQAHRAAFLLPDDETHLEDEDKDLIVMTRREEIPPVPRTKRSAPVEVLQQSKVPAHPRLQSSAKPAAPAAVAATTLRDGAGKPGYLPGNDLDTDDMLADVRPARRRVRQLVLGLGAVGVLTAVCGWLVVSVLHWIAGGQIVRESHQAVASADFRALQELEAKLEGQIELGRAPVAVRQVELALVQTILWYQYTGDAGRMLAAIDGLAVARAAGAPQEEVALTDAYQRLAMGDMRKARTLVDSLPMDDMLHRDIVARVALRVRTDEESEALLARLGPVEAGTPLVELLSRESLAAAMEDIESAEDLRVRLLADHPNNPFVQILRFHEQWDEVESGRRLVLLADVMESLPGPVAPRQEGRLHAQRAELLDEGGESVLAAQSWSAALILDPAHPRYLYRSASERLKVNDVVGALDDLDRCLGARPWDFSCRRAMIQTMIELDRLETARQSVDAWRDGRTSVLSAWVSLAEGKPGVALKALDDEGGTLAAYIRGMALFESGSPQAAASLGPVLEAWSDIPEYMTQVLVGRAAVAQALVERKVSVAETAARTWAPDDPTVYVMLARALEETGQRASADRLYREAAELGPQNAIAQHALGLFWFDPRGDLVAARGLWRRYLDLQPNGDRARRVRARMGRR